MAGLIAKIGMSLIAQLVTEKFIKRILLEGLSAVAKKTENTVDDEIVNFVRDAWGGDK